MNENRLSTNRLLLLPISYKLAYSILFEDHVELEYLGLDLNGNWPDADSLDILYVIRNHLTKKIHEGILKLWMIVKKSDMSIIGDIGFNGRINENGEIEIGCALIESERGKGYGFEATKSLIDWVFSKEDNVIVVKAKCDINNIDSIKALKKCGMKETKRDTNIIYWQVEKSCYLFKPSKKICKSSDHKEIILVD